MKLADLDAATWAELNRLLDVALDLPLDERAAWLAGLGPEHAALAPRLAALLERLPRTGDRPLTLPRLDDDAPETPGRTFASAYASGDVVGPYRLGEILGEGGMGTVWRAERTDGLVRRQVALKLPHGPGRGGGLAERLAREREILAGLAHPGIARLYDAGVTGGQPYLALELVEGVPLDRHAREAGLDLAARLRLFVQVARAVAHAHGRLVVHRDLKPSNVLVTADGQPKLLDFGIAKLLEDGKAAETALTRLGGRALTLAYASPEQVAGRPIGVASDVYGLGVLLFELLAGVRPYRAGQGTERELERAVLEDPPLRASDAATEPGLRRALRGDLDAVLGKALRKEPEERYATADAFADDVERHLDGRPVRAQPDHLGYRLGKFVRRNWLAVGAGAAVALALVLGAGVAAWQAGVARAEQRRAQEVKEFVESIFRDADPFESSGGPPSVADLLGRARARVEKDLAGRPELQVELLALVAGSLSNLGENEAASPVADEAVRVGSEGLGPEHPLTLRARRIRIMIRRYEGKLDDMDREIEALLPAVRVRAAEDPLELVLLLQNRAQLAIDEGRLADAAAAAREALDFATERLGPRHEETASTAIVLAMALVVAKERALALEAAERAYRLTVGVHGEDHPRSIEARIALGRAQGEMGDVQGAITSLTAARDAAAAHHGPDANLVGFVSQNVVKYLLEAGDDAAAEESAARSVRIMVARGQGTHFEAGARASHGAALLAGRRIAEALAELSLAAPELRRLLGPDHPSARSTAENHALALAHAGKVEAARAELAALLPAPPAARPWQTLRASGIVERLGGAPAAAAGPLREALAGIGEGPGRDLERARVLPELGLALAEAGEHAEAAAVLGEAVALLRRLRTVPSPDLADALVGLGRAELGLDHPGNALPLLLEAEAFWRARAPASPYAGEAMLLLGLAHRAAGHAPEARTALSEGRRLLASSPLPRDRVLVAMARP